MITRRHFLSLLASAIGALAVQLSVQKVLECETTKIAFTHNGEVIHIMEFPGKEQDVAAAFRKNFPMRQLEEVLE